MSLKHRFDAKADNCNPAIEHKGASETHRWKTPNRMIGFDYDDGESSNSELGSDSKMY